MDPRPPHRRPPSWNRYPYAAPVLVLLLLLWPVVAWMGSSAPGVEARTYVILALSLAAILAITSATLLVWGRELTPWGVTAVRSFIFLQLPLLLLIAGRLAMLLERPGS